MVALVYSTIIMTTVAAAYQKIIIMHGRSRLNCDNEARTQHTTHNTTRSTQKV